MGILGLAGHGRMKAWGKLNMKYQRSGDFLGVRPAEQAAYGVMLACMMFLMSCAAHAQLIGPNPFTLSGPMITFGGGSLALDAPLRTSIVPTRGGSATYSRATTATVIDHESIVRYVNSGEARFTGARRVQNFAASTLNLSTAYSVQTTVTITLVSGISGPSGAPVYSFNRNGAAASVGAYGLAESGISVFGRAFRHSFYVRGEGSDIGKTVTIVCRRNSGTSGYADQTITLTGEWRLVTSPVFSNGSSDATGVRFAIIVGTSGTPADVVQISDPLFEEVTGQSNTVPAERVSVGILSSPFHGANVDGVRYFSTLNGNTVDGSGVVTEAAGSAISPAPYYLMDVQRTYAGLYSNDFTNAAWVKSNMTAALNQTGADGRSNSASLLTATAGNATALQTLTSSSQQRITQAYVKRVAGSGTIEMTQDNGTTWTPITVTGAWSLVYIPEVTSTNPVFGFRIVTSGDAIAVQYVNHVLGEGGVTSPMTTTSATVTRNADSLTYPMPAGLDAKGSAYAEVISMSGVSGIYLIGGAGAFNFASYGSALAYRNPGEPNADTAIYDGTAAASCNSAGSWTAGRKVTSRWGNGKMRNFTANTAGTEANFDGSMGAGPISIAPVRGQSAIRALKIWKDIKQDAYLQGLTQ